MADNKSFMKSMKAYEKIRDIILNGSKLPGTRLVLSELEDELGIGRGPIREALMRLERTGLVKNVPYKGAIVATPPTQKEIVLIYDSRLDHESKLAVEAIENLTDTDFLKLEELTAAMEEFPKNHYHLERQFHYSIYDASNLPHLCNIVQTLLPPLESVLNIYQWEKKHCIKFNAEHRAIVDALKKKDPIKVEETVKTNIKSGLEIIKQTYNKMRRGPF